MRQKVILELEFDSDQNWTKLKTISLAIKLEVSNFKIYKWLYDRKKKEMRKLNIRGKQATVSTPVDEEKGEWLNVLKREESIDRWKEVSTL